MENHPQFWKKCSSCKSEIPFNTKYWTCNVSTCNQKRTGWVFCKVECWDAHVPKMNHRESWALEAFSPSLKQFLASQTPQPQAASATVIRRKNQ